MDINILGTNYTIILGNSKDYPMLGDVDGYTDTSIHTIIVDDMSGAAEEKDSKKDLLSYRNQVIRREIIHAFLYESGLDNNSQQTTHWASNEEMVDWIAIQFWKIHQAFIDADCL